MKLRIGETAAGHSTGIRDELAFGSNTKAHTTQLFEDCSHDCTISVEEAGEMKSVAPYAPTHTFVAAMRNQDPYCLLTWPTLPSSLW